MFLGEVNSGISSTQVVVKELKASASVQEQMQFLEEAQPYRALQHSNLLQCLAQCAEVTPYLLVMEFCPMVSGRSRLQPLLPERARGTCPPRPTAACGGGDPTSPGRAAAASGPLPPVPLS